MILYRFKVVMEGVSILLQGKVLLNISLQKERIRMLHNTLKHKDDF